MLPITNRRALLSAFLLTCAVLPNRGTAQRSVSSKGTNRAEGKTAAQRTPMTKPAASAGDSAVQAIIERYSVDLGALDQFYNIDFAADRLDRLEKLAQTTQAQLKTVDFNTLSQTGRVDYLLLQNNLDHETRQLGHQQTRDKETSAVLPFAPTIVESGRAALESVAARSGKDGETTDRTDAGHQDCSCPRSCRRILRPNPRRTKTLRAKSDAKTKLSAR